MKEPLSGINGAIDFNGKSMNVNVNADVGGEELLLRKVLLDGIKEKLLLIMGKHICMLLL